MERIVLEFAARAALIAATAAIILLALRIRAAGVQHAVWTLVLATMLALPGWIAWGPKASLAVLPAEKSGGITMEAVPLPPVARGPALVAAPAQSAIPTSSRWDWRFAAIAVYGIGAMWLLLRLIIGTIRARSLTAASCAAPITVGVFRPRILLPAGSAAWPEDLLATVMSHERAHARRRDPLVQWLALLNRALFWFHPLAWWLERRLALLAEDACDAAVLADGHNPAAYSAFLLELARTVSRAGARVNAIGVAMPAVGLPRRIRRILSGAVAAQVSPAKAIAAGLACAACAVTLAAARLDPQEAVSTPTDRPKFEVASIRPCKQSDIPSVGKKSGRGGGGRGPVRGSPGSLVAECQTVDNLIRWAYLAYPDGKPWPINKDSERPRGPVSDRVMRQEFKGPGWMSSDRYTIEAKAAAPVPMEMMRGPMMQALLEERFHLKIRVEKRDTPVYFLTGDGTGLRQTAEGSCITSGEFERRYSTEPPKPDEMPLVCGGIRPSILDRNPSADRGMQSRSTGIDSHGVTLDELCILLSLGADREMLNRTGLTGKYELHLDLSMQDLYPSDARPVEGEEPFPGPEEKIAHIGAAVRKLGFRLEPGKASAPFVAIDHIEHPTGN